jgi:hypothetical protein
MYKFNHVVQHFDMFCFLFTGFSAFLISIASFAACIYYKLPVAKMINEKFLGLITHALILAFILSVFLFVKSYVQQTGISPLGNTGEVYILSDAIFIQVDRFIVALFHNKLTI